MKEFTIDRAKWYQGRRGSELLTADGEMCCLGFYVSACGVPNDFLRRRFTPACLNLTAFEMLQPSWLFNAKGEDSEASCDLMKVNDRHSDANRVRKEEAIAKLFAKQGIKVNFVGKYLRRS